MSKKLRTTGRARSVTDIDAAIGKRLHASRRAAKISQQTLGDALGVSFQQIQKYEKGHNRLTGSRLLRAAEVLGVEPLEILGSVAEGHGSEARSIVSTAEGLALAQLFLATDEQGRSDMLVAARAITDARAATRMMNRKGFKSVARGANLRRSTTE